MGEHPHAPKQVSWFAPWTWSPWKKWAIGLAALIAGYVLSFDMVRFVLISAGRSDLFWTLHQSIYVPVRAMREALGIWP